MTKPLVRFFSLLLILLTFPLEARELRVKQLPDNIEIPSQFINHIEQLDSDYLLVSTSAGARLFDGYQFNPILPNETAVNSPLNTQVYKTLQDSSGAIWFATALGLFELEKNASQLIKMAHNSNNANSLSNDNVREMIEDSHGNLWFATLNGVSLYSKATKSFKNYNQPDGSNDNLMGRIYVLLEETDRFIWIGSSTGLFYIDLQKDTLHKMGGLLENRYITSAIKAQSDEIWFGADSAGIFKLNLKTREFNLHNVKNSQQFKLKSDNVWSLYQQPSGLIWVGYWSSGVSVFDPNTNQNHQINYRVHDPKSLPSPSIDQITADNSGQIWIATSSGMASFNPASLTIQNLVNDQQDPNSIGISNIISIVEDHHGIVWMGTENGLQRWDPTGEKVQHFRYDRNNPAGLGEGTVWMIAVVDDQHLLLATDKGVVLFDTTSAKITRFTNLKSQDGKTLNLAFYALASAGNGWFYVASSASTIHLLNPITGESQLIFDSAENPLTHESEYFQVILPTDDNALWLGSTTGLYHLDINSKKIEVYNATTKNNFLSGNVINDLYLAPDKSLWVATSTGGINILDKTQKSVNFISEIEGLPSNEILSLTAGKENKIWFTTTKHFGYINQLTKQIQFYPLLSNNHHRFSEGATVIGSSGHIYLGGSEIYRFTPEALIESHYTPQIKITEISSLHQRLKTFLPLNETQSIELFPQDSLVTFSFASLDYAFPEFNRYRYKLEGVDSDWLSPGFKHQATYTHLPAGNFKLIIQGTNRDGVWSDNQASLKITVHPTIWKSKIAYLLYSIFLLLVLGLFYQSRRLKRLKELESMATLQKSEARLKDVLWGSGDELWRWDLQTNIISRTRTNNVKNSFEEKRSPYDDLFNSVHQDDRALVQDMTERHISGENDHFEAQFRMLDQTNNCWHWILSRGRIIERDLDGKAILMAGTSKDINEIKKTEKQLRYLANYDQLTQLPNRVLFHEHLDHAIQMAKRFDEKIGLLFFDLDGFKLINDVQGHSVGDQLLQTVAQRLNSILRESDKIARLGGDEFAIIIERIVDTNEVIPTLERIMSELAVPFELNNQSVVTTVSIGIAIYPKDGLAPNSLLKHADIAMYEAKRFGKNCYRFYNPTMDALLLKRLDIEHEMDRALTLQQFETFYQPRVCVQTNQLKGFEALIRWRHPQKGLISPVEFIPVAEETGQILAIGNWVLNDACQQAAKWYQSGWRGCVSINLAALQFQQVDLVDIIDQAIKNAKIPAEFIELEITEGTLINNIEHTRNVILRLKKLGIRIALDDFGTGYSSLSYLQQLPIDVLKIDRSFIIQLIHSKKSSRLAVAIINMAHSLGLEVVAEGVEDDAQLNFLKGTGCEEYQGFLYGKPKPVSEIKLS